MFGIDQKNCRRLLGGNLVRLKVDGNLRWLGLFIGHVWWTLIICLETVHNQTTQQNKRSDLHTIRIIFQWFWVRTDTFTNKSGYLSILVEGGRVDVQGRGFYGEGKNTYLNVRLHRIDLDFNERDRPCFVLHPNNLVIRYLAYSCFSQSLSGTTLFIHQSRVDRKYPAREIYLYIPWLFSKYHTQLPQCCFFKSV